MKNFTDNLIEELNKQLNEICSTNDDTIVTATLATKCAIKKLEELKAFFLQNHYSNKNDEIAFFKEVKPQVISKLIYYNEIYNIEVNKPAASNKNIQKYYKKELSKITEYFKENREFYKYYRTGSTCLDKKLFLRKKHDIRLTVDSYYFQSDYSFATSHDYKVAKIMANENLKVFIENLLKKYQDKKAATHQHKETIPGLKWTGSKVALVELMYALHQEKVINQGDLSLNETAKNIEQMFNIKLGQFNRIYAEIKKRKTIEQSSFLSALKDNFIKRINEYDEN